MYVFQVGVFVQDTIESYSPRLPSDFLAVVLATPHACEGPPLRMFTCPPARYTRSVCSLSSTHSQKANKAQDSQNRKCHACLRRTRKLFSRAPFSFSGCRFGHPTRWHRSSTSWMLTCLPARYTISAGPSSPSTCESTTLSGLLPRSSLLRSMSARSLPKVILVYDGILQYESEQKD
jgi:hypothetical protein